MKEDSNKNLRTATILNAVYMIVGFLLIAAYLIVLVVFLTNTNGIGLKPELGLGWQFPAQDLSRLSELFAIDKFGYEAVQQDASLINLAKAEILNFYKLNSNNYIFDGVNLPPYQLFIMALFGLWMIILSVLNGIRITRAKEIELKVWSIIDIFNLNIGTAIFVFKYINDLKEKERDHERIYFN